MAIQVQRIIRVSLIVAATAGYAFGQQPAPEKHVADIEKEQTQAVIAASPLCQQAISNPPEANIHKYSIDRSTLAPDLKSLMEQSDEVILTAMPSSSIQAIAPSGNDVVAYIDVKVLRSWKGSHKPGDKVTFTGLTASSINCSPEPRLNTGPRVTTLVGAGYVDGGQMKEANILFLRHAQGSETLLTPGLRQGEAVYRECIP
jgi:hypothetical protein